MWWWWRKIEYLCFVFLCEKIKKVDKGLANPSKKKERRKKKPVFSSPF